MFQSIRQGQQFFILHKGENPRCDVGTVVSVSNPVPKYQNGYTAYPLPQNEMVVDVKVKVGDDTLDFQKLPANLSIADFSQIGGNVVVSESKDAINAEIEAMKISSVRVVESVQYHQKVIKSCDENTATARRIPTSSVWTEEFYSIPQKHHTGCFLEDDVLKLIAVTSVKK